MTLSAAEARAQVAVNVSYGIDRNVESDTSELDGWLSATVEWMFPSGLGLGIGTDHQLEGATISASEHLGWALYLSSSLQLPAGAMSPFVRAGLGLGRVPCVGDVCRGGAYFRGSAGVSIRLVEALRVIGEIGITRVSRPFGAVGLSLWL